jgi:hypothetical protein
MSYHCAGTLQGQVGCILIEASAQFASKLLCLSTVSYMVWSPSSSTEQALMGSYLAAMIYGYRA